MQTEQLGFTYFMPLSELCDPSSSLVKAEVGVCRLVDHWKYDSRWEMDHDALKLISYFRGVCLGMQNHVNKFEYNDNLVTNDFTKPFGWAVHDVQGLTRAIYDKFEDKAKVTNLVWSC